MLQSNTKLSTKRTSSKSHDLPTVRKSLKSRPELPFEEWSDQKVRDIDWNDPGRPPPKEENVVRRHSPDYPRHGHRRYSKKRLSKILPQLISDASPNEPEQQDGAQQKVNGYRRDTISNNDDERRRYEDNQVVNLPYSIVPYEWKPVSEVFSGARLVVFTENSDYPDLISSNRHLLHSEFVRSFISSIYTLMYLGNTTFFDIEYVSPSFIPTTEDIPWRPWHHIYSGSNYDYYDDFPVINPIGKYVVRLFWLGAWRIIYVDDQLPLDLSNNVLLPSLEPLKEDLSTHRTSVTTSSMNSTEIKDTVVIWPFLLAKALLKVASLSWYEDREIIDFDIIQCLTGWVPQKIRTTGLSASELWKVCWAYTQHFRSTEEEPAKDETEVSKSEQSLESPEVKQEQEADEKGTKAEVSEKVEGGEKDDTQEKEEGKEKMENTDGANGDGEKEDKGQTKVRREKKQKTSREFFDWYANAYCFVARCNDLRNLDIIDGQPSLFPCWSHEFLIDQTRNIPLTIPAYSGVLAEWKRIRWLSWAVERGMVDAQDMYRDIMSCKIVSAFRQVIDHFVHRPPSKIEIIEEEPEPVAEPTQTTKKKKKNIKKSKGMYSSEKDESSQKKATKAKGKKRSKSSEDVDFTIESTRPDPSFWFDFRKLSDHINSVTIYFKPSRFRTKIEISDREKAKGKLDDYDELEWKILVNPLTMRISRNEPIYIFTDSIDSKLLVINLSKTGHTGILQRGIKIKKQKPVSKDITECEFCLAALIKRIKGTKESIKMFMPVTNNEPKLVKHDRSSSHIVLEEYDWKTDKLGNTVTSLNTYGSKTTTLELSPGRKILKLWIKSDTPYVVHLFSNTPVVAGDLANILSCMSQESYLLEDMCTEISYRFLKLVGAFGTPEFPSKLKAFYNSYKPEETLTKAESNVVHDIFYDLLCELIEYSLTKEELPALKVLLLRWQSLPRTEYPECPNLCNCYEEEDVGYLKALERYAVQIQSLYRGIYERSLLKYHNQSHRDYANVAETLLDIYLTIFSADNRLTICPNLIRALLDHPDLDKIKHKYRLYHDLKNVLTIKKVENNVKVHEGRWAFICRQQFTVNCPDKIPIKINLFCDLDQYVVRVIDNDTNKEIKRYTNNVAVSEYSPNAKGYTVLCYAWSPSSRNVYYRLNFATQKEIEEDQITLTNANTEQNSYYGTYIPNINDTVCKYLIRVPTESAVLSARIGSSYSNAVINFKLYDGQNKLLIDYTGQGDIILPAIALEYSKRMQDDFGFLSSQASTFSLGHKAKHGQHHRHKQHEYQHSTHHGHRYESPSFHGHESYHSGAPPYSHSHLPPQHHNYQHYDHKGYLHHGPHDHKSNLKLHDYGSYGSPSKIFGHESHASHSDVHGFGPHREYESHVSLYPHESHHRPHGHEYHQSHDPHSRHGSLSSIHSHDKHIHDHASHSGIHGLGPHQEHESHASLYPHESHHSPHGHEYHQSHDPHSKRHGSLSSIHSHDKHIHDHASHSGIHGFGPHQEHESHASLYPHESHHRPHGHEYHHSHDPHSAHHGSLSSIHSHDKHIHDHASHPGIHGFGPHQEHESHASLYPHESHHKPHGYEYHHSHDPHSTHHGSLSSIHSHGQHIHDHAPHLGIHGFGPHQEHESHASLYPHESHHRPHGHEYHHSHDPHSTHHGSLSSIHSHGQHIHDHASHPGIHGFGPHQGHESHASLYPHESHHRPHGHEYHQSHDPHSKHYGSLSSIHSHDKHIHDHASHSGIHGFGHHQEHESHVSLYPHESHHRPHGHEYHQGHDPHSKHHGSLSSIHSHDKHIHDHASHPGIHGFGPHQEHESHASLYPHESHHKPHGHEYHDSHEPHAKRHGSLSSIHSHDKHIHDHAPHPDVHGVGHHREHESHVSLYPHESHHKPHGHEYHDSHEPHAKRHGSLSSIHSHDKHIHDHAPHPDVHGVGHHREHESHVSLYSHESHHKPHGHEYHHSHDPHSKHHGSISSIHSHDKHIHDHAPHPDVHGVGHHREHESHVSLYSHESHHKPHGHEYHHSHDPHSKRHGSISSIHSHDKHIHDHAPHPDVHGVGHHREHESHVSLYSHESHHKPHGHEYHHSHDPHSKHHGSISSIHSHDKHIHDHAPHPDVHGVGHHREHESHVSLYSHESHHKPHGHEYHDSHEPHAKRHGSLSSIHSHDKHIHDHAPHPGVHGVGHHREHESHVSLYSHESHHKPHEHEYHHSHDPHSKHHGSISSIHSHDKHIHDHAPHPDVHGVGHHREHESHVSLYSHESHHKPHGHEYHHSHDPHSKHHGSISSIHSHDKHIHDHASHPDVHGFGPHREHESHVSVYHHESHHQPHGHEYHHSHDPHYKREGSFSSIHSHDKHIHHEFQSHRGLNYGRKAASRLRFGDESIRSFRSYNSNSDFVLPNDLRSRSQLTRLFHQPSATPTAMRPHHRPYLDQKNRSDIVKGNRHVSKPLEYRIEVKVVDDSWPLNSEEWKNVQNPVPDGSIKDISHGTSGSASLKKLHSNASSKRLSTVKLPALASKRMSTVSGSSRKMRMSVSRLSKPSGSVTSAIFKRSDPLNALQKPYWIMETFVNRGEIVNMTKDSRRENEIKSIKSKWNERDPGRPKKGLELRKEFLSEIEVPNPNLLSQDKLDIRSLVREAFERQVLPPFDLSAYMIKDPKEVDEDSRELKGNITIDMENRRQASLVEKSYHRVRKNHDNIDSFFDDQKDNLKTVKRWFKGIRAESHQMREQALKLRQASIAALLKKILQQQQEKEISEAKVERKRKHETIEYTSSKTGLSA